MQPIQQRGETEVDRREAPVAAHARVKPVRGDVTSQHGENDVIDRAAQEDSGNNEREL